VVDTYTKWILTIIAAALVALVANNIVEIAHAQIAYARVQICDQQNCAQLYPITQSVQGRTVVTWGLPVVVTR
jgi:hypothetical protein